MIARCRAKCWVIQLKEENAGYGATPNTQRGLRGHVIIYPQRPSSIAEVLPPSLEEVSTPICVIFVGSHRPSDDWLRTKAKPLVHVVSDKATESLTSRYDSITPLQQNDESNSESSLNFQNVVITDVDGGGYIEVGHDPVPVNEFFNPTMFPMIYPTLFPYGIGGFENKK
ncbi:hypothetical protein CPB84DRAFT_1817803 [Gymnopilus junonius]|uniref:DUF6570 domain-containing protein n=1 Tax=Gymnopilus junonius TaxID=109634 RepID=A0A9P5NA13_GYMJU|nr:hypothetical protein CPB84DRAFT_1817803 [Gymnopilus junonius]